ncbi:serine-threonine/tyrosine-protein kinase catalytic domain-containing protein [Artemisia annua]|uniref:Serine-threonine/tyrosine-protein kinase catalytic domain-containing protein n=1 Tax=Artemisia annua TaxID=35608 RepID=A0A2U1M8M6_ARTAN|nr:serine-threonine/tyrosine-protein kinase catalytic domain-containing protein [Artemisia annua]
MSSTGNIPSNTDSTTPSGPSSVAGVKLVVILHIVKHFRKTVPVVTEPFNNDDRFIPLAMVKFLDDMEREKPVLFTSHQLRLATANFSIVLGSGAFGTVYKGIFSNGVTAAVKVLNGTSDKRIEEQFMAEVSTMGRTHHVNLVRLYGFCFESSLRALVYEFMVNGSLDHHLFKVDRRASIGFDKLHEIALGTARGIAYLHEGCLQRIVHYDIKPGNILLDANFCAKVADFGLAKLFNRENTHITMTGGRGTPGYAAPELWMPQPVTHKCDVYSFGMLLFEIIGRRRNMDTTLGDSLQWFPLWAWNMYEKKELNVLMTYCGIEKNDQEVVERMLKVALCCVQYRPETRPVMSIVVKMLEGALEVPDPLNPFSHLISGVGESGDTVTRIAWNVVSSGWSSSDVVSNSTVATGTPIMRKYEITVASARHNDSDAEESNHEDAVSDNEKPKQQQQLVPVANIKLPILKKEEYDIWAMEMEHYLEYIDNDVWKVIQNGNSKKRISVGKDGTACK